MTLTNWLSSNSHVGPAFGTIEYARRRSPSAVKWAERSLKSEKYMLCDPAEGENVSLPKTDREWESPDRKEFGSDATGCAHAMFHRECVLYNGKNKSFYALFSCKNDACSKKGREDYFSISIRSGYGNLKVHALTCFGNEFQQILDEAKSAASSSADKSREFMARRFMITNEYEKGVYKLICHLLVHNDLPFEYLRRKENREVFAFPKSWLTPQSMRRVLQALVIIIERKISEMLPDKFAIYFDGWSHNRLHFLGVVASFIFEGTLQMRLISLSPIHSRDLADTDEVDNDSDEIGDDSSTDDDAFHTLFSAEEEQGNTKLATQFGAQATYEDIEHVLDVYYGKSWENVTNLGGDNTAMCHKLCVIADKPYDPCCSHLQSLELNNFIQQQESIKVVRDKIHVVMKEAAKPKVAAEISNITDLKTSLPGETRWSANRSMMNRYFQWERDGVIEKVKSLKNAAPERAWKSHVSLARDIFDLQDAWSKDLQKGGTDPAKCNMSLCWNSMEAAASHLEKEGETNMHLDHYTVKYIRRSSEICNKPIGNKHFLEGIYKIQMGAEARLTVEEKLAVAAFKKPVDPTAAPRAPETDQTMSPNAKQRKVLLDRKAEFERGSGMSRDEPVAESAYIDTRFVVGTNNVCERVFSRARRVSTEFRRGMDPLTMEAIVYVKLHKDLWGAFEVAEALRMDTKVIESTPVPGSGLLHPESDDNN